MIDIVTYRARIGLFHSFKNNARNESTAFSYSKTAQSYKYKRNLKSKQHGSVQEAMQSKTDCSNSFNPESELHVPPSSLLCEDSDSNGKGRCSGHGEENTLEAYQKPTKLLNVFRTLLSDRSAHNSDKYDLVKCLSNAIMTVILVVGLVLILLLMAGVESNPGPDIGYDEMNKVAQLIGNDWKKLARDLFQYQRPSITEANVIQAFETKPDNYDKCYEMLIKWTQESDNPSKENLIQSLRNIGKEDIARALEGGLDISQPGYSKNVDRTQTQSESTSQLSEMQKDMLQSIAKDLREHYTETSSKLIPIPSIPETSTAIQDVYTNLEIYGNGQEVQLEDIFLFEDNPKDKCTKLCDPKQQKHEVSRRVLVEGAPGSGKSTKCRKLAFDWANPPENKYWIHRFELVFLIEVRHLTGKIQNAIFEQLLPLDIKDPAEEWNCQLLLLQGMGFCKGC